MDIEVLTIAALRDRTPPGNFSIPSIVGFDVLMRIEHGRAENMLDFNEYVLEVGDICWVHPGQVHRWGNVNDIEGTMVLCDPGAMDERTKKIIDTTTATTHNFWPALGKSEQAAGRILDLLRATECEANQVEPRAQAAARTHLVATLMLLLAGSTPAGAPATRPEDEVFRWFRIEVDKQFATEHSVNGYAAKLGYSPRTLNRVSRSNAGLSAKQFIDQRVILEAKRLLTHGDLPIHRIADILGFSDVANFNKYFLQRAGVTPAAFRHSILHLN
ncbi:AraC family transcriptional regulator [Nocardia sp. NPDC052316]|uniref:AraC family transcriptional regulator n=1 Tax=Nocardia sp. NPDC052316 TaxID=3364329 RepID=UPI0037C60880